MQNPVVTIVFALCLVVTVIVSLTQRQQLQQSIDQLSESQRLLINHVVQINESLNNQSVLAAGSQSVSLPTGEVVSLAILETTLADIVALELDRYREELLMNFEGVQLANKPENDTEPVSTPQSEAAASTVLASLESAIQNGNWEQDDFNKIRQLAKNLTISQKEQIMNTYGKAVVEGRIDPRSGFRAPPI